VYEGGMSLDASYSSLVKEIAFSYDNSKKYN